MKNKIALKKIAVMVIAMIICMPIVNLAHSGKTDSSGGHKDNKNKSGLGSYHYHCGGHPAHLHEGGVCPYSGSSTTSTQSKSSQSTSTSTKSTLPAKVNATSVEINLVDVQILIGETKELTATVFPSNTTDKTITWKSNNSDVAIVDSEGRIVGMSLGEATITATTSNGKEATVKVTVNPIKVSEIKVNESELNLKVDDSEVLIAEVLPENATDKTIEWSSENPEIVTVEAGVIKAIASGTTKVICQSKDGVKSEINIIVEKEETVAGTIERDDNNKDSKGEMLEENTAGITVFGTCGGLIALASMIGLPIYGFKSRNKEEKNNIKKYIVNLISYVLSIITLFFSCAATSIIGLVVSIATGLSMAPPICKLINQKLDEKYTMKIRIIVYIIGFILMIALL